MSCTFLTNASIQEFAPKSGLRSQPPRRGGEIQTRHLVGYSLLERGLVHYSNYLYLQVLSWEVSSVESILFWLIFARRQHKDLSLILVTDVSAIGKFHFLWVPCYSNQI